jgi:hypothetical protein
MAAVLAAGGFPEEAPPLLAKALRCAITARLNASGETADPSQIDLEQAKDLIQHGGLSPEAERVLAALRPGTEAPTVANATELARSTARLVTALTESHIPQKRGIAQAALTA